MPDPLLVVLTTAPDQRLAEHLAATLVEEKLAACVNILPPMTSVYSWKGKIEHGTEHQLLIKTSASRYPEVQACISGQHPYELPEILALPVSNGLPGYIEWVHTCTKE